MNKTITTETTFQYDNANNITNKKTLQTISEDIPSCDDGHLQPMDDEVETGIEIEGVVDVSPVKAFLAAAAGAFIGNLIYHAVRGD